MPADPALNDPQLADWQRQAHRAIGRSAWQDAHAYCMRILQRDPGAAEAYLVLALIAAAHDNYAKALHVIERALRLNPRNAAYHAHRGRFLIALHRPADASLAAERSIACEPADALCWDTLGVVFTRAGAHEQAVMPYRRAVALDPAQCSYWYNLGAALQFMGEFAEAETAYRRTLALDPEHYRAWSALGKVGRLQADDIAALESMLAGPIAHTDAELHLCHALARQREIEGDFAGSFELLVRGKRRKRAAIQYSIDDDRAVFAAARMTTDGGARSSEYECAEPIFIVGMPRTGTTLIERILSSHPQVFAAGELSHFSLAVKRIAGTRGAHVLDAETLTAAATMDLGSVGEQYIRSTRPRTGHTRFFIDKMPLNFLYAGLIRRALPRARIICMRRHPLDACLSNFRQLFATAFTYYNYSYDVLDTGRYYLEFDRLARHWRETLGPNYVEVHYEEVVNDTEQAARSLLSFCDLPWDPACLDFHRNTAPVATASSVQVRQPIYRSSIQQWQRYLPQVQPLVDLLGPVGPVGRGDGVTG